MTAHSMKTKHTTLGEKLQISEHSLIIRVYSVYMLRIICKVPYYLGHFLYRKRPGHWEHSKLVRARDVERLNPWFLFLVPPT